MDVAKDGLDFFIKKYPGLVLETIMSYLAHIKTDVPHEDET